MVACVVSATVFVTVYLHTRTAFYDDTFIYLHIADNILSMGTARYFPVAHNISLIASSPLKLCTITLSILVTHLILGDIHTQCVVKATLLGSSFLALALVYPWWRRRIVQYFLLCAVFWLLSFLIPSFVDMEGGLLFVLLATLAMRYGGSEPPCDVSLGVLSALLLLARPDVGTIWLVCVAVRAGQLRHLCRWKLPAIGFGGILALEVIVLSCLGTWPLPSSIWSKAVTARQHVFSTESFLHWLPTVLGNLIGLPQTGLSAEVSRRLAESAACLIFVATLACRLPRLPVIAGWLAAILVMAKLASNYGWYYDNACVVLIVLVGLCWQRWKEMGRRLAMVLVPAVAACVGLSVHARLSSPLKLAWDFDRPSRMQGYLALAGDHLGGGVFRAGGLPRVRLRMCEIGIVAFFSGPTVWLDDVCGLAQAETLSGAGKSPLRFLYPASVAVTAQQELASVSAGDSLPVLDAWGVLPDDGFDPVRSCPIYTQGICFTRYR